MAIARAERREAPRQSERTEILVSGSQDAWPRAGTATNRMTKILRQIMLGAWCAAGMLPAVASAQAPAPSSQPRLQPAPVTSLSVDGSEAMFTTMCALLAAGFESNVSAENWHPLPAPAKPVRGKKP